MNAPFIKLLKVWLALLTAWLGVVTVGLLATIAFFYDPSPHDPKAMWTRWYGDSLNISNGGGQYFVTHLKDVSRHSFAELPKPLLVASSGGVLIPHSDLQKLNWIKPPDVHDSAFPPATNEVVAAPAVGTQIEAIYLFPARAEFKPK